MEPYELPETPPPSPVWTDHEIFSAEVVLEPPAATPPRRFRRRVWLPLALFVITCLSTFWAGYMWGEQEPSLWNGLVYSLSLMTILVCHEAGHFLQARRYHVHASLPYFIPMPITPIGTMGAVIAMEARVGDRKAIFDIGISGPLAGLVPTLLFCVIGLNLSHPVPAPTRPSDGLTMNEPYIFQFIAARTLGPLPEDCDIAPHPLAFAGWVGLLITSLNLFPIGQLDGGHILYGLLRKRAHGVSWAILLGAATAVIAFAWLVSPIVLGWLVMLSLLFVMGPKHPPTANDDVPLGAVRTVLGWLTLAFLPLGFTPIPFA